MEQDYYKILRIDPSAPEREIKRAYYALASKLHPDKAKDQETRRKNEEQLALVSAAYNILKDSTKRKEYDIRRAESISSAAQQAKGSSTSSNATQSGTITSAEGITPPPTRSSGVAPAPGKGGVDLTSHRVSIAERAFAKGMQLFNAQNFHESVPFLDAAIQNDDTKAVYHIKMAVALIRSRGSYTRAITHAQRAIEGDPYKLEYKLVLADIHETAGAITAACKLYEEVLKWEPDNGTARYRLDVLKSGGKGKGFLTGLINKITKK